MIDPDRLRSALEEERERLDAAAERGGRPAGSVEIVLAAKYVPPSDAGALVAAGVRVVGENRLQDLEARRAVVGDDLTYDFIGHLQRRKVRSVLPLVRLVHTLDSARLAEEIQARASGPTRLLIEVNVAGEETKCGIVPRSLEAFIDGVSHLDRVVVGGLMALPPAVTDPEHSRPHFAAVRELAERLRPRWAGRHDLRDLSMGTSQDAVIAAEEGATLVRIGRSLVDRGRVS